MQNTFASYNSTVQIPWANKLVNMSKLTNINGMLNGVTALNITIDGGNTKPLLTNAVHSIKPTNTSAVQTTITLQNFNFSNISFSDLNNGIIEWGTVENAFYGGTIDISSCIFANNEIIVDCYSEDVAQWLSQNVTITTSNNITILNFSDFTIYNINSNCTFKLRGASNTSIYTIYTPN